MKKIITTIILTAGITCSTYAQDTVYLSLPEAIQRSISYSVDAVVARNEYKSSYWEYRTFKAELLPEVTLSGTSPYYSKSYNSFQNGDGSYTFVSNDYSSIKAGLSVSQNIPWTGGVISLQSDLQRLEQYGGNSSTRYKAVPASVSLEQPLFGFNSIKWQQKIEPVKYKEAGQKLAARMEEIANLGIQYYFNLLLAQINHEIAEQNLRNTEKLYAIAEARRKIGQITENDLLQLKISLLKAEAYQTDANADLNMQMFNLRSFLRFGEDAIIKTSVPDLISGDIPHLLYTDVLSRAHENNSFTQNVQRRILEASRDVSAKKADRWQATLFASFGVSGLERSLHNVYESENLRNDQTVNVGLRIPVLDWGKRKGKVKIAEANLEVVQSKIEKEQMDFNQNIYLRVQNFNNQSKQVEVAKETDMISQQRYNTSVEAFIIGKIDVLNLNDSQSSKDYARRNYIEQVYYMWSYYYQIRALTLYDFVYDKELTTEYAL